MLFYKYMIYSLFFLTMLFTVVYFSTNKSSVSSLQSDSYNSSLNTSFYWMLF